MEKQGYTDKLKKMDDDFERICRLCGLCCGLEDGDPCSMLIFEQGRYLCKCYPERLGPQKTVSGKPFTCVPIRERIRQGALPESCAYRNI